MRVKSRLNGPVLALALLTSSGFLTPLLAQANEVELGNIKSRIASIQKDTATARPTIVGSADFELSVDDLERKNAELQKMEETLLRNAALSDATKSQQHDVTVTRTEEESEELIEIKELSAPKSAHTPKLKDEPKIRALIEPEEVNTESVRIAEREYNSEALAAKQELDKKSKELASVAKAKGESDKKLKEAHSKIAELLNELEETRNRLMVAETQVDRLARIADQQAQTKVALSSEASARPVKATSAQRPRSEPQSAGDMPVATVVVDKANLRAGPGAQHSVLMEVGKGSRLAVEDRLKDWYRVTTPTGTRAWVSSEVIAFGPDYQSSPTQTVKIRGFDANLEDKAFELIRSRPK